MLKTEIMTAQQIHEEAENTYPAYEEGEQPAYVDVPALNEKQISKQNAFKYGAAFALKKEATWIKVDDRKPDEGFEVLGFNKGWIDEDFNPRGIRNCFLNGDDTWTITKWCEMHSEWHTCYDKKWWDNGTDDEEDEIKVIEAPTHWFELPQTSAIA